MGLAATMAARAAAAAAAAAAADADVCEAKHQFGGNVRWSDVTQRSSN